VFDEIYEPGLIISQAAKRIRQKISDLQLDYDDFVAFLAPDDLWNTSQENGRCKADIWSDYGVNLTKSKRDRSAGWLAIKEDLAVDYGAAPEERADTCKLKIFSKCANLIRCLPKLQTDPKNSDDCMKDPHELTHGPDALRTFYTYWLTVPDEIKNQKSIRVSKELYEDYLNASDEVREYLENKYGKIFCI
jgi:phage terminase large subunit